MFDVGAACFFFNINHEVRQPEVIAAGALAHFDGACRFGLLPKFRCKGQKIFAIITRNRCCLGDVDPNGFDAILLFAHTFTDYFSPSPDCSRFSILAETGAGENVTNLPEYFAWVTQVISVVITQRFCHVA